MPSASHECRGLGLYDTHTTEAARHHGTAFLESPQHWAKDCFLIGFFEPCYFLKWCRYIMKRWSTLLWRVVSGINPDLHMTKPNSSDLSESTLSCDHQQEEEWTNGMQTPDRRGPGPGLLFHPRTSLFSSPGEGRGHPLASESWLALCFMLGGYICQSCQPQQPRTRAQVL